MGRGNLRRFPLRRQHCQGKQRFRPRYRSDAQAEKQDPALRKDNASKRRASRGALPAHLPRIEVTLTPEDTACPCCKATMTVIGEDTSERLDVIPAQFRVLVTKRPKLACRSCPGTLMQEPAPARLIEGGLPTEALVAHVLVARYADHLPLYRQAQMMQRQGVLIDRATLSFWMGEAGPRFRLRSRWNGQMRVCGRGGLSCGRSVARDAAGLNTDLSHALHRTSSDRAADAAKPSTSTARAAAVGTGPSRYGSVRT